MNSFVLILLVFSNLHLSAAVKNVLFFVVDDLRPELRCYYENNVSTNNFHPFMHTPNIDALAAKSLLLKRAYAQVATCNPSRSSFLTGRRPGTTKIYNQVGGYFRDHGGNFTTLPQYFKMKGYNSVGMGKIFQTGRQSNYDDPISWNMPYFHAPNQEFWSSDNESWMAVSEELLQEKPLPDYQIAEHAVETLRSLAPDAVTREKPFFMAVGFRKPHLPFTFPETMLQYYPEGNIRLPDNQYPPHNMPLVAWSNCYEFVNFGYLRNENVTISINSTFPEKLVLDLRRAYFSSVSWVDSLVGRVLTELQTLGLADNTVVSLVGDHGWQLGEHGEWCKSTNFELSTRVPMMLHIPGVTNNGIVSEQIAELVDLFPTITDAVGLGPLSTCPENSSKIELCAEGVSLLPMISNPNKPLKKAAFSLHRRQVNSTATAMGYSIRTQQYRYTEWVKFSDGPLFETDWSVLFGVELYDHGTDPDENINKAHYESYREVRHTLSKQLRDGWRQSVYAVSGVTGMEGRMDNVLVLLGLLITLSIIKTE